MTGMDILQPVVALAMWTMEGLKALSDKFVKDVDGPLGWSTDENAFLLKLQVVHAAEVLLRVGTPQVEELKSGLKALVEAGKGRGGNVLSLGEAGRVLAGEEYSWEAI